MGRKKIDPENKKIHFGVTLHPELGKILEERSKKENKSISKFIEDVMKEHLKNNENMND
jgi:metal-responsive CopG/Arc/MetJ family transcriptional regulator